MNSARRAKLERQRQAGFFERPKLTAAHYERVRKQQQAALPAMREHMTSAEIRAYVKSRLAGFALRQAAREKARRRAQPAAAPPHPALFD